MPQVEAPTLDQYQHSLDRVYAASHDLMAQAPNWQSALYASLRCCYTEMSTHPECLRLHFIVTAEDAAVQAKRSAHRDRLLDLLAQTRTDAPVRAEGAMMLSAIHRMIREQILRDPAQPPNLNTAEQTFAGLLFHYQNAP